MTSSTKKIIGVALTILLIVGIATFLAILTRNDSSDSSAVYAQEDAHHDDEGHNEHDAGSDHADHGEGDGHDDDDAHKEHDDDSDHTDHGEEDDHDDHLEGDAGHEDAHSLQETGSDDAHEGHDDHDEGGLSFTKDELAEFGISVAVASSAALDIEVSLPGEVRLNEERLAHVVPKLSGIVHTVNVSLGDRVSEGQVLAILDSRELASAKAAFLAAREHLRLAQTTYARERDLWNEKISAERDYLESQNELAEARIALQLSEQELEALGYEKENLEIMGQDSGESLTHFEIRAPFAGTLISKHLALGEYVEANADVFTVADLGSVWIDLSVYQKDLSAIHKGQTVLIQTDRALHESSGTIAYVGPIIGEETRTALARIILPNPEGSWRPGMFIRGSVAVEQLKPMVVVPKTAVITIDSAPTVFVQHEDGFEPATVRTGRDNSTSVEIVSGLEAGQSFAATGVFHLKAELDKAAFAHSGHAH